MPSYALPNRSFSPAITAVRNVPTVRIGRSNPPRRSPFPNLRPRPQGSEKRFSSVIPGKRTEMKVHEPMSRQDLQQGFYQFDDDRREILIDRYDIPSPWMNYLSNGSFTAMLSQAGGGLAFYRSPQIFRLTRYRFFHLPTDRPGPYLYLRDERTGRYWCPTSEPAVQKPERWQAAHGMGYTRFRAGCGDLSAELTYFVGPEEDALIWQLTLHNEGTERMDLSAFAYVEFSLMEFLREIQWQCYNKHQVSVEFDDRLQTLVYHYDVENQPKPEETPLVYLAGDRPLVSFDGDRDAFIGSYRSEANPLAIEQGGCTGSTLNGGDPCGALQCAIPLEPGERAVWHVFLGAAPDPAAVARALEKLRRPGAAGRAFAQLKQNWEANLGALQCDVPDETVARMINTWNPYQVYYNALLSQHFLLCHRHFPGDGLPGYGAGCRGTGRPASGTGKGAHRAAPFPAVCRRSCESLFLSHRGLGSRDQDLFGRPPLAGLFGLFAGDGGGN